MCGQKTAGVRRRPRCWRVHGATEQGAQGPGPGARHRRFTPVQQRPVTLGVSIATLTLDSTTKLCSSPFQSGSFSLSVDG